MKVYHGGTEIVEKPLTSVGRNNLDFGRGFYVTDIAEQAISWAKRPYNTGKQKILNIYDFQLEQAVASGLRLKQYDSYDMEWLDFVIANRQGSTVWKEFDIVSGGIANDRIFNTIELYTAGIISKDEALERLKYEKPNRQICIISQQAADNYLLFSGYKTLEEP